MSGCIYRSSYISYHTYLVRFHRAGIFWFIFWYFLFLVVFFAQRLLLRTILASLTQITTTPSNPGSTSGQKLTKKATIYFTGRHKLRKVHTAGSISLVSHMIRTGTKKGVTSVTKKRHLQVNQTSGQSKTRVHRHLPRQPTPPIPTPPAPDLLFRSPKPQHKIPTTCYSYPRQKLPNSNEAKARQKTTRENKTDFISSPSIRWDQTFPYAYCKSH